MTIKALIVDDEAPARKRLRDLLARAPDVDVVQECRDGPSVVAAILKHNPDLLFLDVQMPEMSGLEVLERVGVDRVPAVVFVTAYDQHAVDAKALDYLLKPFTEARFLESLQRVRKSLRTSTGREDLRAQLASLLESDPIGPDRIPVRRGNRIRFVEVDGIDRIEGAGNYVRIHVGREDHLVRGTLKGFAQKLRARGFLRIHHSHVVNWDKVEEVEPWGHGEYLVRLKDGTTLVSSRTYTAELRGVLDGP